MRRFTNVLVCSEQHERDNRDLALQRGAALVLRARRATATTLVLRARATWKLFKQFLQNLLSQARHGRRSSSAVEITRKVLRGGHDLVVCTERDTRPRSPRDSTALQLSRLCPCPVWAIRSPGVPPGQHVLAAVNPYGSDRRLDIEILDTALDMARLLGRTLHVVHIWEAHGVHLLAPRTSPEAVARYVESTLLRHRAVCEALMSCYAASIPWDRLHLRKGSPVDLILRVAAELDADPIVMGTAARRGVAGLMIGNTAERVVRRTDRSVVIVKPPDFASPLAELPAPAHCLPRGQAAWKHQRSRQRGPGATSSRAPAHP